MAGETTEWFLAFLLPHVSPAKPIEAPHIALVPPDDARLESIAETVPAARTLLSRFSDQFGNPVAPSAILVDEAAGEGLKNLQAISAFRNAIALSTISASWQRALTSRSTSWMARWSDHFDFYPYVPTKDGSGLNSQSAAALTVDTHNEFRGQTYAHVPRPDNLQFAVDAPLLQLCLARWEERFVDGCTQWTHRALFRSLEIAFLASRVPAIGTRLPSIHDVGIALSLWVSALEILKPSARSDAGRTQALDLVGRAEWRTPELRHRRYVIRHRHGPLKAGGKVRRFNYTQKLVGELYRARNDFLHGNRVTSSSLFPARDGDKPNLFYLAPLVYRTAVLAFLGDVGNVSFSAESMDRWMAQSSLEDAVMAAKRGTALRKRRAAKTP